MNFCIITGANCGLGEEIFNEFFKKSDFLVISISLALSSKQKQIKKENKNSFVFFELDLQHLINPSKQLNIESLNAEYKPELIIFFSNASTIHPIGEIGKLDPTKIDIAIKVNIFAPIILTNHILNIFSEQRLLLFNITSGASNKTINGWSIYSISKLAISKFYDFIRIDNSNNNLKIINFDPGMMNTKMQGEIRSSKFKGVKSFIEHKKKGNLKSAKKVVYQIMELISNSI